MRVLITADLHLTNRPLDSYRWEFFQWLREQRFETLVILGDLADDKDFHCSTFVNRVVEELTTLTEAGHEVHLLMGNHDYSCPDSPFFEFLKHYPGCYYHATPQIWELGNMRWAFYPHSREPSKYLSDMRRGEDVAVDFTLCHQMFNGAVSEHGKQLEGWRVGSLSGAGKVFAGDVHVPQVVGDVEYVGAPYPIHFGDNYKPHVVVVNSEGRQWSYLKPPSLRKLVVEVSDPSQIEFDSRWQAGDQVKVVLKIGRSDFGRWEHYRKQVRRICERNELVLCGIELKERIRVRLTTPARSAVVGISRDEQFRQYCKHAGIDKNDAGYGSLLLV
jgi:hypothetical protein